MPPAPTRTVDLTFLDPENRPDVKAGIRQDISCLATSGRTLFVACDETASIECLVRQPDGGFGDHTHVSLGDFFKLPGGRHGEMDIEGLAASDGYLWITGSHSLKRDKPKRDTHDAKEALARLRDIDRDPNRYFLGCVPIAEAEDGSCSLRRKVGKRRAACIKQKKKKSRLLKWLKDDDHLSAFLSIPSKENGFDIEGLAAHDSRVWLGLRGPVLRGHGVILELNMKRPDKTRLKARRIDGKARYRKHLLDTDGLGIRDLCVDGDDILVLVGTPLASDGPARILRWHRALQDSTSGVVEPGRLTPVLDLPYRGAQDHPEGLDLLPGGGKRQVIVAYDSPAQSRLSADPPRLAADVFDLEG